MQRRPTSIAAARPAHRGRWTALVVAAALTAAACSGDGGAGGAGAVADPADTSTTASTSSTVAAPADTATSDTATNASTPETSGATAPISAAGFERVVPGGDCRCADGSEYAMWVRPGDPTKVLFFFQGGGACFSALTCSFSAGAYDPDVDGSDDPTGEGGVLDTADERNPFAGWSVVYAPYCTGDVHLGDNAAEYGDLVVEHRGAVNARAALDELVRRFPSATDVVVAGESAGAVPTPLYAALVSDELPAARVTAIADGSGAYPDVPAVNALIGGQWGTERAIPDWPVNQGFTAADWSFPDLFVQAGRHAPDVVFARHDYADDRTQALFAALAGIGSDDLLAAIDANEAQIEGAGVDVRTYISPGEGHTILSADAFYSTTVDGVALVDWVRALVTRADGPGAGDVRCDDCTG